VRALREENAMLRSEFAELRGTGTVTDVERACVEAFANVVLHYAGVVKVASWKEAEALQVRVLTDDWDLDVQRSIIARETELLDSQALGHCLEIVPLYGEAPGAVLPGDREVMCH